MRSHKLEAAFILFVLLLLIFLVVRIRNDDRAKIGSWATGRGYQVISVESRIGTGPAFTWYEGGRDIQFYEVIAKSPQGVTESIWVRFGYFDMSVRDGEGKDLP